MNHCINVTMQKKKNSKTQLIKKKKKKKCKHLHTHMHICNYKNVLKHKTMTIVNIVKTITSIINNFIYINFDKFSQA